MARHQRRGGEAIMFSGLQWTIFAAASIITFICYHAIPSEIAKQQDTAAGITIKGFVFTGFIRACGTDHLVMLGYMWLVAIGRGGADTWTSWVAIGSASLVASVSLISALILRQKHD